MEYSGTMVWVHTEALARMCESPIERLLIDSLTIPAPTSLTAQYWIRVRDLNYRIDFAIPERKIAIEVDGHETHCTNEQRTYDAKRDRLLRYERWRVFHFTGSEVSRNPYGAAAELLKICKLRYPLPIKQACSPLAGLWSSEEHTKTLARMCESPIQRLLINSLTVPAPTPLTAQYWVRAKDRSYRIDFAIPERKIAIEVDGHDAHCNNEQRTYDAKRDRLLQYERWRVFHFTGSEVSRDPYGAAAELLKICDLPYP